MNNTGIHGVIDHRPITRPIKQAGFDFISKLLLASAPPGPITLQDTPLVVAGLFKTASGIGKSAQLHAEALKRQGLQPICVDLSEPFNQVDMTSPHELSQMPKTKQGVLILHLNALETRKALWHLRIFKGHSWSVVGYWAWELPAIPESWYKEEKWISEIWVPSKYVASAFSQTISTPVKVVPHSVFPPTTFISPNRELFSLPEETFVVLAMADGRSSLKRKNIKGAIEAFKIAFCDNENATLVLKTRNVQGYELKEIEEIVSKDSRVIHINESFSVDQMTSLLASCDCFLSLHRSEGFGLVIAEMLALNKPVIATAYSGGDDMKHDSNYHGIDYTLVPVGADQIYGNMIENAHWADPNIKDAAHILKSIFAQRARS